MRRLAQFWATASPPTSVADRTILVDLMHGHPEYLYRSLVVAKFAQLITGGRLVGLVGAPRLVTMFLDVDAESTLRLASAFGLRDTVDLTVENQDDPLDAGCRELAAAVASGPDGEPLSPASLDQLRQVTSPDDRSPLGKALQELYMRSELDARMRYGDRLKRWCSHLCRFDSRVRSFLTALEGPAIFVTGHLDYHWGHIARHVVRAGGRVVHYRLDNRMPVSLVDSIRPTESPNATLRRSNAAEFERFEQRLANDEVLATRFSAAARRLSIAVSQGLGSHFRSVPASGGGEVPAFDRSVPTYLAFAHTFTDQPVADLALFPDHFLWLDATLSRAAEAGRFNLLVKAHPLDETYDRSGAIEELRGRFEGLPNIAFTRQGISHPEMLRRFDAGITVRGSPGVEMTAAGLPMILAGRGPYGDCGFCISPASPEAYFRLLEEGIPADFDRERQRLRASIFQAYDRFWAALTSPLLRPYSSLPRDDAWWLRIEEEVQQADILTDPLFLSLRRAWARKDCRVVPLSLAEAIA